MQWKLSTHRQSGGLYVYITCWWQGVQWQLATLQGSVRWRSIITESAALRRKKSRWPALSIGSWYANIFILDLSSPPPSLPSQYRFTSRLSVTPSHPPTLTPFLLSSCYLNLTHSQMLPSYFLSVFLFSLIWFLLSLFFHLLSKKQYHIWKYCLVVVCNQIK